MKKLLLLLLCASLCQATNATLKHCAGASCKYGKHIFCCTEACQPKEGWAEASYSCKQINAEPYRLS